MYFLVHQVSIQNRFWPKIYHSGNNIAAKHPVKEKKNCKAFEPNP